MTRSIVILMTFGMFIFTHLKAQELAWSQFRGQNGCGQSSEESTPPIEFGEDSKIKWKVEIPEGSSSPIIWKDQIYITACIEDKNEMQLICLNRNNGATIWTQSFFPEKLEGAHPISNPAQSTPVLDNAGLYVYYASYGVICYDHEGKVKWKTSLPIATDRWGHATSPVIMEDKIILSLDYGGDDFRNLTALDKHNGELAWKTLTQEVSHFQDAVFIGYSTPIRYENQIIIHRFGGVASYSLEDGSPIWWMPIFTTGTSSPIVVDSLIYIALWNHFSDKENKGTYFDYKDFHKVIRDFDKDNDHLLSIDEVPEDFMLASRVEVAEYEGASHPVGQWFGFIDNDHNHEVDSLEWSNTFEYFSSYVLDLGVIALEVENKGEISIDIVTWIQSEKVPEVPSPIAINGFIFTVKDGGWVSCIDRETGKLYYSEKLGTTGGYFASPVAANGHLYFTGHRGIVHVIKASNYPEVESEIRLEGKILATPAIAENELYIRTSDYLYAFGK
jgi:outer membrane protein assembly factor BamB